MSVNWKDATAGAIFFAFGAYFLLTSVYRLDVGTAVRMDSGYFPALLGGFLAILGLGLTARSLFAGRVPSETVPWRGIVCICLSGAIFGLTVQGAGLAPTLFAATLVSAFASKRMTLAVALALSIALTAFCLAVFSWGLSLRIPVLGPWIGSWL